jgi:hypothetical protein
MPYFFAIFPLFQQVFLKKNPRGVLFILSELPPLRFAQKGASWAKRSRGLPTTY